MSSLRQRTKSEEMVDAAACLWTPRPKTKPWTRVTLVTANEASFRLNDGSYNLTNLQSYNPTTLQPYHITVYPTPARFRSPYSGMTMPAQKKSVRVSSWRGAKEGISIGSRLDRRRAS